MVNTIDFSNIITVDFGTLQKLLNDMQLKSEALEKRIVILEDKVKKLEGNTGG